MSILTTLTALAELPVDKYGPPEPLYGMPVPEYGMPYGLSIAETLVRFALYLLIPAIIIVGLVIFFVKRRKKKKK